MSELTIFSSDSDVKDAIRKVLATYAFGHNVRWELEVQRRKLSQYEENMRTAKCAYATLFNEEIGAHEKAFREAKRKYKLTRKSWICAVQEAREALNAATTLDMEAYRKEGEYEYAIEEGGCDYQSEYTSDPEISYFRFLSDVPKDTAEYVRNKALRKARRRLQKEKCKVRDDCIKAVANRVAYPRSHNVLTAYARRAINAGIKVAEAAYKKEVAEIEEAYYQARLMPTRNDTDAIVSDNFFSV